jgi:hypothetical protein
MRGGKVPLERPALPSIEVRLEAPSGISIFGAGGLAFGRALAEALAAAGHASTLSWVQLTHARGFDLVSGPSERELHLHSDPSTLMEGLRSFFATDRGFVIGVGEAFAVAVHAPRTVWISGGASALSLPAPLRAVARAAQLVLESPRVETARALAKRMAPTE